MAKKESGSGKKQAKPRVHKELKGFEVSIDQFGELTSSMNIEKINSFLDKNVDDKKNPDLRPMDNGKETDRHNSDDDSENDALVHKGQDQSIVRGKLNVDQKTKTCAVEIKKKGQMFWRGLINRLNGGRAR